MATTTNFGWETPDDTDLVKDGAAAMRTLGNSIDTSFVDLKGGTSGQMLTKASATDLDYTWVTPQVGDITSVTAGTGLTGGGTGGDVTLAIGSTVATLTGTQTLTNKTIDAASNTLTGVVTLTGTQTLTNKTLTSPVLTTPTISTIDAKGDLLAGTADNTIGRRSIGANGTVLTADSAESTGMKWATPASGGGMTLLSTTTLTTTSHTISSISQDYKHIVFYLKGITSSGSASVNARFNGDTATNYQYSSVRTLGSTVTGVGTADTGVQFIDRVQSTTTVAKLGSSAFWLYRYTDTDYVDYFVSSFGNDGTNGLGQNLQGNYNNSAAITSATFYVASGNLGGTIYTYGVN